MSDPWMSLKMAMMLSDMVDYEIEQIEFSPGGPLDEQFTPPLRATRQKLMEILEIIDRALNQKPLEK